MEFATRGRSTSAVDDDGRRFPDPPPRRGGDADPAPVDVAALAFRRETLLRELHKERIRQEMILCELAETEHAMAACLAAGHQSTPMPTLPWPPGDWLSTHAAGWDAWRGRPSMPTLEEKLYRTPRSSEQTSWWCRSPSEQVILPVYPHVERSPSPVLQPRTVDDAEQKERSSSSRPLSIAPSACPGVEQRRSLSKEPAVEEALVPTPTNAVAKPTEPALFSEEVTPDRRAAVGQEREAGSKDSHAVQLMESRIQRSEQPKRAAVGQEREAEAKDSHDVQLMESGIQSSEQAKCAAVVQEHEAEAKDSHAVQLMGESGIQSGEQPKPAEHTIEDRIDKCRQSPCQYTLAAKEKPPSDEQKRLTERHKPLGECSCTLCRVNLTCEEELAQHRAGQLHRSNLTVLQSRQKTTELIAKSTPESSHGAHRYNVQSLHRNGNKNMENSEPQEAKCASGFDLWSHLRGRRHQENTEALQAGGGNREGGKRTTDRMGEDLRKKWVNKRRLYFCQLCQVQCNSEKMLESHLGGKKHREMLQGRH